MKQYKDLTQPQKKIFEKLEATFIKDRINLGDLCVSVGIFLNKWKKEITDEKRAKEFLGCLGKGKSMVEIGE